MVRDSRIGSPAFDSKKRSILRPVPNTLRWSYMRALRMEPEAQWKGRRRARTGYAALLDLSAKIPAMTITKPLGPKKVP